jgi:hypothetical protein
MPTLAYTIVQLAATLLTLAGQNTTLSAPAKAQAVAVADQAVATAMWALAQSGTGIAVDVDANFGKLQSAMYLTEAGARVPLGAKAPITGGIMALLEDYISFGHLDADGLSDAMPIIRTVYPDGRMTYHLAVMRNFGGVFVNTLRQPIAEPEVIYSHRIADSGLYLDYKPKGAERATTFYTVHSQFKDAPEFIIVRNPETLAQVDRVTTTENTIASFVVFAAPWSGGVTVRSATLNKDFDHGIRLADLRVAGSAATQANVHDAESEMTFPLELSVPAGEMRTINVYADITGGEAGTHASVIDLLRGEAVDGNGFALPWPAQLDGQDIVVR